jgi:hypothetical protein
MAAMSAAPIVGSHQPVHVTARLVVTLALLLAGCGNEPRDDGERCERNEDCKSGYCESVVGVSAPKICKIGAR